MKNIRVFIWKVFSFSMVKFSIYLNRCVFRSVEDQNDIPKLSHLPPELAL